MPPIFYKLSTLQGTAMLLAGNSHNIAMKLVK